MNEERDNFIMLDEPSDPHSDMHRDAQNATLDEDELYASFIEHREAFQQWLDENNPDEHIVPTNDDELRAYSCAGWRIYSPRWDAQDALNNSNTRSWEAIVIFSKVQSAAWLKERFKGCGCTPLRVNDQRCAEKSLLSFRRRKKATRGKKSFTPSASDLGGGDAQ